MEKIALNFGLKYCHEYFQLDGIFYRKQLPLVNKDYLKKHKSSWYAKDIEVIIEHENNFKGIKTEIYKLIPLYVAPLKVIITYLGGWQHDNQKKIKNETEKIKRTINERIKKDDVFDLHKNKIETLLIVGLKREDSIYWQGFIFKNGKVKELKY